MRGKRFPAPAGLILTASLLFAGSAQGGEWLGGGYVGHQAGCTQCGNSMVPGHVRPHHHRVLFHKLHAGRGHMQPCGGCSTKGGCVQKGVVQKGGCTQKCGGCGGLGAFGLMGYLKYKLDHLKAIYYSGFDASCDGYGAYGAGYNCACNGSYKHPVPPLYSYHWPGLYAHRLMTDYHSPHRFPPLKPYTDEAPVPAAAGPEPAGSQPQPREINEPATFNRSAIRSVHRKKPASLAERARRVLEEY